MNKMTKLVAGVALASSAMISVNASAELSYNIGWASEYHYRGVAQEESSAYAGADFEQNGFYAGTWAADVGDGLEVDAYFGYGIETESGFSASIGFTGYYYTGEFDDTYEEINLNFGYSIFNLEYSAGEYDNFGGDDLDYDFIGLTVALESGFYGTFGSFGDDADGDYLELGYGTTIAGLDIGAALIFTEDDLQAGMFSNAGDDDENLIFTIGKTF
ncbi:MAG: TorF family putative porin [Pseudomonadales bacterium]|nr:TorF family putative porin [Pseudomonadales bacterium]